MLKPDFRPVVGSDDFRKLQDYWIFCYAEWYETNKGDPTSYNELWVNYYSGLILNAMDIPSLRYTLIIMMHDYGHQKYMQEFYIAMHNLAASEGKSLVHLAGISDPVRPIAKGGTEASSEMSSSGFKSPAWCTSH